MLLVLVSAYTLTSPHWLPPREASPHQWSGVRSVARRRRALAWNRKADEHLVFVRYDPDASIHVEWVYNSADLGAAAGRLRHDLGPERNGELIAALPGRSIWMARVSQGDDRLAPYPDATPLQPTKR